MLFDESELKELDKLAVKTTVDRTQLTQKPALKIPHWIGVSNCGRLEVFPNRLDKGYIYLLETESLEIAQEMLNAMPDIKSRGIYVVPKWNSSPVALFYSSYNFHLCSRWLSKVIEIMGYEKRNTYKVIKDPLQLATELYKKREAQKSDEAKNTVAEMLRKIEENREADELARKQAFQEKLRAMKERHAIAMQEQADFNRYKYGSENSQI